MSEPTLIVVRCVRATDCDNFRSCLHGRFHIHQHDNCAAKPCYDYKVHPDVVEGRIVWCELIPQEVEP